MIEVGGFEYRIRPYEEIESRIGPMAKVALATVHAEDDFNTHLEAYEGIDEERQQELRMDKRAGIAHFHFREHFAAWVINGNFVKNFSIVSNAKKDDDPENARRGIKKEIELKPATADELLNLPSKNFEPFPRLHGRHANRESYLRALIVPECAEVIVPVTIAVSEHYAKWQGATMSREARHDRHHLHKGLRAAHNILATLTDVRDPYADLRR